MEELRVHVERIVRPIHAGPGRKNKMREELLGHLMQKAQDLVDRGASEETACTEAIEQLGDPSELRKELQAGVPRVERIAYAALPASELTDRWFDKPDGQSAAKFALLRTFFTTAVLVIEMAVFVAVQAMALIPMLSRSKCSPLTLALLVLGMVAVSAVVTYLLYYGADIAGLVKVMSRRTPGSIWRKGAALVFFMIAYLLLFLPPAVLVVVAMKPREWSILEAMFGEGFLLKILLGTAVAVLILVPSLGYAMKREHEEWMKWGRLEL